jgi:cysteine synthase A
MAPFFLLTALPTYHNLPPRLPRRRQLGQVMRALGARVIITPAAQRGTGMVKKAVELSKKHGWFLCRQFETEANAAFHAQTTGPEILSDFAGKDLDYWVTGYGTGGTLQGVGKMLKLARPDTKIVVAEPAVAALVSSGKPQDRNPDGSGVASHPAWTPHPVQGWTPDFIPLIVEQAQGLKLIDETVTVTGEESVGTSLRLMREEGIFTGISGGGSMAAALKARFRPRRRCHAHARITLRPCRRC